MKNKRRLNILITAGATREAIDPVRFISNYSTGRFAVEIALEAKKRGHRIVFVYASMQAQKPQGVVLEEVNSALQMKRCVEERFNWCDCLVMAAAVSDYRVKNIAKSKIKRQTKKELVLKLTANPDILAGLTRVVCKNNKKRMTVGFALETADLAKGAKSKLRKKRLDLIVAVKMLKREEPFGNRGVSGWILDNDGGSQRIEKKRKPFLAGILLDRIEKNML